MDTLTLNFLVPASAEEVYTAWIDPVTHRDFSGGNAVIDARNGGHYAVWDGYITGIILKLEPNQRIVESWRTTDFHPLDPSSTVEILFSDTEAGCNITIHHSDIPNGHKHKIETGWLENYFEPMLGYFTAKREKEKNE